MKRMSILILAVLAGFSGTVFADDYDFTATKAVLDSYVNAGKLAGGVLLVTENGEPVLKYASGSRDLASNSPMQTDSLFRIASQTKALTSVAVMILQERGKLETTDTVAKYFPAFKNTTVLQINEDESGTVVPASREITIHDLLTHSAGISYGWGPNQQDWVKEGLFDWYYADKNVSMQEALKTLASIPQAAQPGTEFVYGHSTDILGALVAKISGMSLREFFKKEITGPLGMTDTDFIVPAEKTDRLATVYNAKDGTIVRAPDVIDATTEDGAKNYMITQGHYTNPDQKAFAGGAGLVSTADDYTKFLLMLMNGGELDGKRILSSASVEAMTRDQIPYIDMPWNDGISYAFQLTEFKDGEYEGKLAAYEWGGAYHSNYVVRPLEKITIVYLTQLIPTGGIRDWEQLRAMVKISMGIEP